jgi:hypothetical protein
MTLEQTLLKIADGILNLDEASLVSLWEKYRQRMEQADTSRDWERSVIVFFIINAVRAKNQIFNEQLLNKSINQPEPTTIKKRKTTLRLIKTDL